MADWTMPLPFSPVTALCVADGKVLLGGSDGIARQFGHSWESAELQACLTPIAALASVDGEVLLAGALGDGVFRSTDRGCRWVPSNFGLTGREVTSLVVTAGGTTFAGTSRGVYWSTNAGKAWRQCTETDGLAISAMSQVANGDLVAALESGPIMRSADAGRTWTKETGPDVSATALAPAHDGGLVMGTTDAGIWRQDVAGSWHAMADDARVRTTFALATDDRQLVASTPDGLAFSSDGGSRWRP